MGLPKPTKAVFDRYDIAMAASLCIKAVLDRYDMMLPCMHVFLNANLHIFCIWLFIISVCSTCYTHNGILDALV